MSALPSLSSEFLLLPGQELPACPLELADVAPGETAQERAERGRRPHPAEHLCHRCDAALSYRRSSLRLPPSCHQAVCLHLRAPRPSPQPPRRVPQYQEPGRIATFFCMSRRERVPLRAAGQYTLCSEALTTVRHRQEHRSGQLIEITSNRGDSSWRPRPAFQLLPYP